MSGTVLGNFPQVSGFGAPHVSPLGVAMMQPSMAASNGMPPLGGGVGQMPPLGSLTGVMGGMGASGLPPGFFGQPHGMPLPTAAAPQAATDNTPPPWAIGMAPIPQNVLATANNPNWMQGTMPEGLRQQTLAQQGVINIPTNDPSGGQ